ncbi:MAG: UvrD-helicase domain-containing protein [Saprospiraceae bacterium]|nr:UvrD-helicase domain-containing protein [Saprospiraceae bacterium]
MVIIKDEHIREAEKLLINGNEFDSEERVPFIKKLSSCDLLAVPGSGKTTALLAKLYCISKNLPYRDGSGILVLSHTNAAVNEIENNLKRHCPKLFEYPNFVGTVQSFVNTFLANPGNCQLYGSYISKNDDEVYNDEVIKFFLSLQWSKKGIKPRNLVNTLYLKANYGRKDQASDEKKVNTIKYILNFKFDFIQRKILGQKNNTIFKHGGATSNFYEELEEWKINQFRKGVLSFNDSYSIGDLYLNLFPGVKAMLKKDLDMFS